MAEAPSRVDILLARGTATIIAVLIALGVIWYGVSADVLERLWQDVLDRPAFRFLAQPAMGTILAVRDGTEDARLRPLAVLLDGHIGPEQRLPKIQEGLIATGRVILLGLVMDVAYQSMVFATFYPGEAAIVALLLAFLPYLRSAVSLLASRAGGASRHPARFADGTQHRHGKRQA